MNLIDATFEQHRAAGRRAFIPFVTAGDPDLDFTIHLVRELAARGASLIEIGFPYSDPIADGPVIQASYTRALDKKITVESILQAVSNLTQSVASSRAIELPPLVAMVSYAIVFRRGAERFVEQAKRAGFAGAVVPDLPVDEAAELAAVAARNDFKLILLVTPTTPRERAVEIARTSSGFIYSVSVIGITGERADAADAVVDRIAWLKSRTALPVCVGFGISRPEQVRSLARVADGVIVGSAIVRRVADGSARPNDQVIREIGDFVGSLIEALKE